MVDVHGKTTELFNRISGLNKRSLASKYLHFHVPKLFYIYDARAVKAMSQLSKVVGRASKARGQGDNEYRKFVQKCGRLKVHCVEKFGITLLPRQLDNFLLSISHG